MHINANGDPRLFPAGNYMSKLTIETLEQGVEYAQTLLVFVWLTLNIYTPWYSVSIVNFEHVSTSWVWGTVPDTLAWL